MKKGQRLFTLANSNMTWKEGHVTISFPGHNPIFKLSDAEIFALASMRANTAAKNIGIPKAVLERIKQSLEETEKK
jgi:hypothetical protein